MEKNIFDQLSGLGPLTLPTSLSQPLITFPRTFHQKVTSMTSLGLTKRRPAPVDPPPIETTDPREIVTQLINGLSLARVPKHLHPSLLAPLTAAKTENLVAGRVDTARTIQEIIRNLDISVVKPDPIRIRRGARATTPGPQRLPLISTSGQPTEHQFRLELAACEDYWNSEIRRYDEMRRDAVDAVSRRFDAQVAEIEAEQTPMRGTRPSSALQELRRKHNALGETARNQDERERIEGRMEVVEYLDQKEQQRRAASNIRERIMRIRAEEENEKAQLTWEWDEKWNKLMRERREDMTRRRAQIRKCGSTPGRPRSVLRKTLPAGRLSSFTQY